jgi:hypothetical protein
MQAQNGTFQSFFELSLSGSLLAESEFAGNDDELIRSIRSPSFGGFPIRYFDSIDKNARQSWVSHASCWRSLGTAAHFVRGS